jgi:hypothetical protein
MATSQSQVKDAVGSILSKTFAKKKKASEQKEKPAPSPASTNQEIFFIDLDGETAPEAPETHFEKFGNYEDEEDLGTVVKLPLQKGNRSKNKKGKWTEGTGKKKFIPLSPVSEGQDWKAFRKYWKKLFLNYSVKVESSQGRKVLLSRLKKYKTNEQDSKTIRVKLSRLMKRLKDDGQEESVSATCDQFKKFESFIQKQVKILKKSNAKKD